MNFCLHIPEVRCPNCIFNQGYFPIQQPTFPAPFPMLPPALPAVPLEVVRNTGTCRNCLMVVEFPHLCHSNTAPTPNPRPWWQPHVTTISTISTTSLGALKVTAKIWDNQETTL